MVRVHPDPPDFTKYMGGLAQLGEHLLCKQGVNGSIPLSSTNIWSLSFTIFVVSNRKKLEASVALMITSNKCLLLVFN